MKETLILVAIVTMLSLWCASAWAAAGYPNTWLTQVIKDTNDRAIVKLSGFWATSDSESTVVRIDSLAPAPASVAIERMYFSVNGLVLTGWWSDRDTVGLRVERIFDIGGRTFAASASGATGDWDFSSIGWLRPTSFVTAGSIVLKSYGASSGSSFTLILVLRKFY
ncbi:MAG: hypothetical protein QME66_04665 [Candidatus Eisenbacteria bacterium]|nr:hypothetical protein [Candidatus Eisenbacteria bacterium]